ncbi:hypothetical protein SY88_11700 [Clostridiales bacterium PH28_bin88]|nr:hypothetical protein SY88_11700 [Clostridiales bacterium PH28_bin88]
MEGENNNRQMPKFAGVEEMAEYFDSIDTEELEWQDSQIEFERPEMVHITVRIPKEDLVAIKRVARKHGLGYTAFIRMMLHYAINAGDGS